MDETTKREDPLPVQSKHSTPQSQLSPWCTSLFGDVFGVTLNVDDTSKRFLESTFTELVEEGLDPQFEEAHADRIIIEYLTEVGNTNPFKWLRDCWAKVQQYKRTLKAKDPLRDEKLQVLEEIDRLTSNYGLVAFQIEDMFINGNIDTYLKDVIANDSLYSDFIIQILYHAHEEGTLLEFLNVFVVELAKEVSKIDFRDSHYQLVLNVFQLILSQKPVAAVFTQIDNFHAKEEVKPHRIETTTLLGPLFRLSPLQSTVSIALFDENTNSSSRKVKSVGESLQAEHKVLLERLFFITDKIIRGSEQSRNDLLKYFATIVNKNHLRRGDHADFSKLASNAFMTNIAMVLIRLSLPFLDSSLTKLDKIDPNYFQNTHCLIDISEETRANATNAEANEYFEAHKIDKKPNFISDCFYLTLTYLQYGLGGLYISESKLDKLIKHLKSTVENLNRPISDPSNRLQMIQRMQLPALQKKLEQAKSEKNALTSFFIHRNLQLEIFDFIAGSSAFLVRTVEPTHLYPKTKLRLPFVPDVIGVENVDNSEHFREQAPVPYKYFPEFCVEGVINFVLSSCKFVANPMVRNSRLPSLMEFMLVFLRCPELIGNPHLKGRLVEVLSIGTYPMTDGTPGFMQDIIDTDPLLTDNLLYALLDFYVVVEKTGSSSQFYDKFNSRFHISCILEQIWKNSVYKRQLIHQSEHNEEFFIRFVARMLNDLTFLLDESLRQLQDVHAVQNELELRKQGGSNMDGTNEDLESRLSSAENQARADIQLANRTLDLFDMFTGEVPKAFIKPEIVGRLASMLDYNLEALVGPKCTELKVREPEKYKFNPKDLLLKICKVFVNLSSESDFTKAVANDSRSFKRALFNRAEDIIRRWGLANEDFIKCLVTFADKAEETRIADEAEEQDLGEIPDEYLDPLMYTLMEDPVILPGSKVNIDRATIRSHLLSDSTDPFNRMPLKYEDVIPNDDLKQEILDWKRGKKANKSTDVNMTDA